MISKLSLFFLVLIFHGTFLLHGQVKERYLHSDTFTFSESVEYLDSCIFLNKAHNNYFESSTKEQWLLKLDLELNPMDSLDLAAVIGLESGHDLYCVEIKGYREEELLVLLNEQSDTTISGTVSRKSISHLIRINSDLSIISKFKIEEDSNYLRLLRTMDFGNSWIMTGFVFNYFKGDYEPLIIKLDTNGNILNRVSYDSTYFPNLTVFLNTILVDSNFVISIDQPGGLDLIAILDQKFDLLSKKSRISQGDPTFFFPEPGRFVERANKPPILMGFSETSLRKTPQSPLEEYSNMGVAILDSSFNISRLDTFPNAGFDFATPLSSIGNVQLGFDEFDYNTSDSVLLFISGQLIYSGNFWEKYANDLYIYNYNANTESLNWMKVYNSGYSNAYFTGVAALPNGEYVLLLNEYNWDKYPFENSSIHLMIINRKGDILSGPENLTSKRKLLTLFPMPFKSHLTVQGLPEDEGEFSFVLFSIDGKEIEKGSVGKDGYMEFAKAFSGPMIIRIYNKQGLYQSIRVLKQ